ncbi:MAG: NADP-dependent oxidoreductase [Alphaproteobacteria bacterium]|nr:NADP-dependent oxidoreductase [Alphaproteobacteria bacterium]
MPEMNRRLVLANRPHGMPKESDWRMESAPVSEPEDGKILARALYLSVDPYMRGRIATSKSYAKSVEIGETMVGGGVGRVVASRHPDFQAGDTVESMAWGWQDYAVLDPKITRKLDQRYGSPRDALGLLGLPGLTAYFALLDVGQPNPGETVVVSSASGAVGQVVGQIAKIKGCRTIAVAGDDRKIDWCVRDCGYDAGVNYKTAKDLPAALAAVCPDGIDVYFDNTGGPIHDAVMGLIRLRARIIICGTISNYNRLGEPDMGPRHLRQVLINRARIQGFLLWDFQHRYQEAITQLAAWAKEGRIKYREDVMDGLQNMPRAFLRLLTGENFGKLLVKIADA